LNRQPAQHPLEPLKDASFTNALSHKDLFIQQISFIHSLAFLSKKSGRSRALAWSDFLDRSLLPKQDSLTHKHDSPIEGRSIKMVVDQSILLRSRNPLLSMPFHFQGVGPSRQDFLLSLAHSATTTQKSQSWRQTWPTKLRTLMLFKFTSNLASDGRY
jgi:hypothetical protein